jgi:sodium/bile acid cotransporter 7
MVLMAKLLPFHESYNQYFNLAGFIDWGIAGIFLLYGLKLNLKEVVKDVSNWKLHLLIQSGTFIIFQLLILIFYPFVEDSEYMSRVKKISRSRKSFLTGFRNSRRSESAISSSRHDLS